MFKMSQWGVPVLAAAWAVMIGAGPLAEAGVIQSNSLLPPEVGQYEGGPVEYPQGVLLEDVQVFDFMNVVRVPVGSDEEQTFDSTLTALVTYQGAALGLRRLMGPITVLLHDYVSGDTGTFDTEIVSMDLTGQVDQFQVSVQESPSMSSMGQTTITDLGNGTYQVDSFFDIWTELDVGGTGFMPQEGGATSMVLTPEPAGLSMIVMGGLVLLRRRR